MPQVDVKAELLAIREANGGVLTARVIVDAATDPAHPLHDKFEWNDAVAGARYRLQQARQLVRVLTVEYIDPRGHPDEIRVFHSLPDAESGTGRSYIPIDEIKENQELTDLLRRQMNIEWRALKRKYDHFVEFARMVQRDMRNRGDGDDDDGDTPLAV